MRLAVTIDVEEEGLFRGRYDSSDTQVDNVLGLTRLDDLFRKHGIRPTLLVSYGVAADGRCRDLLGRLAERWGGEIGAHLHHWSTPPLVPSPHKAPVPSEYLSRELLAEKLANLLHVLAEMGVRPVSFRMGRFSFGPAMLGLLERNGFLVDSSVAPMRSSYGGPAHLAAPWDPYFPDPDDVCKRGASSVLEVPITMVPVVPHVGNALEAFRRRLPSLEPAVAWIAENLASLPAQPCWTGLGRLKAAAALHKVWSGRVLTIFFHSSEVLPGYSPAIRTEDDSRRFLNKLERFFSWLRKGHCTESVTLSDLRQYY